MSSQKVLQQTPEEQELSKKQDELTRLQIKLAQKELDFATLRAELNTFERKYLGIIGIRYAELDEIEAQIAEILARSSPKDHKAQDHAYQTRARAKISAHLAKFVQETIVPADRFIPSEALKKLYREVAKCIHPDLSTDEKDRVRRQHFMVQANQAYEAGDENRLREILTAWENSPEAIKGDGVGAELIRVIRKISQVEERIETLGTTLAQLQSSDLYRLKKEVEEAEAEGQDLLAEMASQLDQHIADARTHLAGL